MNDNKIKILDKEDENFPWFLKNMNKGPEKLYCIGNIGLLNRPMAAIVGARKCSEYGRQVALKLGETLAQNDIVTVSGMALGIDSCAHAGALGENGKTIAVLGCGPDVCYPYSNKKIYNEICQNGLIISEYPPSAKANPWHFPCRNRIIAAISKIVVVVEAAAKSGSLITATCAAELGKEVFAVPGNINSHYSKGCNKLISDGAGILTEIEDIVRNMGIEIKTEISENILAIPVGKDEKKVYDVIGKNGEITIEHLAYILGKDTVTVSGIVTTMELKGIVAYDMGKIHIAKF